MLKLCSLKEEQLAAEEAARLEAERAERRAAEEAARKAEVLSAKKVEEAYRSSCEVELIWMETFQLRCFGNLFVVCSVMFDCKRFPCRRVYLFFVFFAQEVPQILGLTSVPISSLF